MRSTFFFSLIFSALLLALAVAGCLFGNGYQVYLIAIVCLTAVVGVGLNVLLGLIGAFIGRWIFLKLGIVIWGFFGTLAAATVGAVLLVAAARLLAGSRGD